MTQRRGLSILEVLIAIAVLGVVFVAIAGLQISSLRVTSDAQSDSQLLQAAVTRFERVRTDVFSDFDSLYAECTVAASCGEFGDGVLVTRAPVLEGLLQVSVSVEQRGRVLRFVQYLSCLDKDDVPTLSEPGICDRE